VALVNTTGWCVRTLALAALCVAWPPVAVRADLPTEYEVKAAYLYNFARFVEWPPAALPAAGQSFVVAVLGVDPFGGALEATLAGKRIMQRDLSVRRVTRVEEAAGAQIVFISASESPRLTRVLTALEGQGVLTVSDMDDFARQGGMIGFRMEQRKVRFDINPQPAARARLKISSQLLRLAQVVGTP
jgi:uncharacterized protein DUF4154